MSVTTLRALVVRLTAEAGRVAGALAITAVAVWLLWAAPPWPAMALALVGLLLLVRLAAARDRREGLVPVGSDALEAVRADARRQGGGAFIGLDLEVGGVVHAPAETAVLVIGPPRRGKSTSVVIPTVLTAPGPVVSTSTKPDVLLATAAARSRLGSQWAFDPTGLADLPEGVGRLRWSPLDAANEWASARRIAAAMVGASPAAKGTRHESHWTSRAAALLGPLLYAAALAGCELSDVVAWVLTGNVETPASILLAAAELGHGDADLAGQVLAGVERAADQERQSIWSATSDVIDVYTTAEALAAAARPNWSPHTFVRSADTVYITAPAEHQASVAPLVVALLEAVRDAQYQRHRAALLAGQPPGTPVTLALDEVANVAPIASLPALVSEAGGQGLHVLAAVQDLSQVRGRWGTEVAEGFLSLFQHVLVLGGVRDTRTLEALSVICGEWDRPQATTTRTRSRSRHAFHPLSRDKATSANTSWTTHRQRRLVPGEVYGILDGHALHLHGSHWRHIRLAPHYDHPRWQAALGLGYAASLVIVAATFTRSFAAMADFAVRVGAARPGWDAGLVPLGVDVTIVAGSVMAWASARRRARNRWAYALFAFAAGTSIALNVAHAPISGASTSAEQLWWARFIAALPPVLLLWITEVLLRHVAAAHGPGPAQPDVRRAPTGAGDDVWRAVEAHVGGLVARPSQNAVARALGLPRTSVQRAIAAHRDEWNALADPNGHHPDLNVDGAAAASNGRAGS